MTDLPNEYIKALAEQLIFISAFLGGFSATILGTLIVSKHNKKIINSLIISLSLASASFIITVVSMTKITLVLTPGAPYTNHSEIIFFPRILGSMSFYIGIISLVTMIGISGWLKSKKLGIVTTSIAIITFIMFILTT